eukprot:CFRG2847T1
MFKPAFSRTSESDDGTDRSAYNRYLERRKQQSDARNLDNIDDEDRSGRQGLELRTLGDLDLDNTEQSSMDKPIPETNVGYKLLLKMGWKDGNGLGLKGDGRKEPVRLNEKLGAMGLGRWTMEINTAELATENRKKLFSEMEETDELREKWKVEVEKAAEIKEEIKKVNEVFYCADCDKQYVNVMTFENHLSSYDHHHTKRLKDLAKREKQRKSAGSSRKKEDRKLQKEMAKLNAFASAAQAKFSGVEGQTKNINVSSSTVHVAQDNSIPHPPMPPRHEDAPPPPPPTATETSHPHPPPLPPVDVARPALSFGFGKMTPMAKTGIKFSFGQTKRPTS